ncbi:MAG: MFS transporter [Undibacterium sp.]|nr:MFS transporter [Opitutaceae bacterium]
MSLGLPDGTLGVAWPQMYPELRLPIGYAGGLMVVITALAATAAFSSGWVVGRFGTGPVVLVSGAATGSALLALSQVGGLPGLVLAVLPLGLGAGAVDAALNGFVARHYSGRQMNWLHACWGIGATSGPLVIGFALGHGSGWRGGYLALGSAQLALAGLFLVTLGLWARAPERAPDVAADGNEQVEPTLGARSLAGWLSPGILAIYVAAELTTGLWAGSILIVARGFEPATAAMATAAYYGSITVGRIAIGFVVDRWGNRRMVGLGVAVGLGGALLFTAAASVPAAVVALVLMGLGFAPVYPGMMHEVPRRFAPGAVQTIIGRQAGAAGVGAAIMPAAAGAFAGSALETIPWLIVGCVAALLGVIWKLDRIS